MKTLFVSDLDGTLLNDKSTVSPHSVHLLNDAIARGALFTVATARTPATVSALLKDIKMPVPAIVMTGAALWNQATDAYSHVCHFTPETVTRIRGIYSRHNLPSFLYTLRQDGKLHIYHTGEISPFERDFIANRLHNPYKAFHLDEEIPECVEDAVLFFAMQPPAKGEPAFDELREVAGINPMFYFDTNYPDTAMIEAFPGEATKAKALARLKRETGATRTVAFGDNRNDIPLLLAADVAVAVENAIPEVKAVADIVIGPNTSDSVARFIADNI